MNGTMFKKVSVLLLICFAVSGNGQRRPVFDVRNRQQFRGIDGNYIEMPCMVHRTRGAVVSWTLNGEVLSEDAKTLTQDPRIKLRKDSHSGTWMLTINPLQKSDAGDYVCRVSLPDGEEMSKTFNMVILDNGPDILWRPDNRCGRYSRLEGNLSHVQGECDGQGAFHCCSYWGWCGFTADHCNCRSCIDYSEIGHRRCSGAYIEVPDSDLCFGFGPTLRDINGAKDFCAGIGGSLLTHQSLEDIQDQVNAAVIKNGRHLDDGHWLMPKTEQPSDEFALASFLSIFGLENTLTELEACVALSAGEARDVDCKNLHFPLCVRPVSLPYEVTAAPVAETTAAPEATEVPETLLDAHPDMTVLEK